MRVELTRTFPVATKKAFDYLIDFTTWPSWYTGMLEIIHPDETSWKNPGDEVRFMYRLLGRRVEAVTTMDEVRQGELVKLTSTIPMVGEIQQQWIYHEAGEDATTLTVIMQTGEMTSFFGKVIDRMLIPRVLERDLTNTLDHLEETFAMGIPE